MIPDADRRYTLAELDRARTARAERQEVGALAPWLVLRKAADLLTLAMRPAAAAQECLTLAQTLEDRHV